MPPDCLFSEFEGEPHQEGFATKNTRTPLTPDLHPYLISRLICLPSLSFYSLSSLLCLCFLSPCPPCFSLTLASLTLSSLTLSSITISSLTLSPLTLSSITLSSITLSSLYLQAKKLLTRELASCHARRALRLIKSCNFSTDTMRSAESAVLFNNKHPDGLAARGLVAFHRGRFAEASTALHSALSQDARKFESLECRSLAIEKLALMKDQVRAITLIVPSLGFSSNLFSPRMHSRTLFACLITPSLL